MAPAPALLAPTPPPRPARPDWLGNDTVLTAGLVAVLAGLTLPVGCTLPGAAGGVALYLTCALLVRRAAGSDPLGPANLITLGRLVLVSWCLMIAFAQTPADDGRHVLLVVVGTVALALDRVDGTVARRLGVVSAIGARLDIETDSALTLVLAIAAVHLGDLPPWVLLAGVLRYLYLLVGVLEPRLTQPLPFSQRRRVIGVTIVLSLLVALAPGVPDAVAVGLVGTATVLTVASFVGDALTQVRGFDD